MTQKKYMVTDLTEDEMVKEMYNPQHTIFFSMHPLVQHSFRVYYEKHRGSVEIYNPANNTWTVYNGLVSEMFLQIFRMKKGHFFQFILNDDVPLEWK